LQIYIKTHILKLLFFDFGSGEIILVVLAILLVFGPSKIPEIARNVGKFINDIKRASEGIKTEINREADRIDRNKRLEEYKSKMESTENITENAKENDTFEDTSVKTQ